VIGIFYLNSLADGFTLRSTTPTPAFPRPGEGDAFRLWSVFSRLIVFLPLLILVLTTACSEEEITGENPFIILDDGNEYTQDGNRVPVGGQLRFGLSAAGGGAAITNLRVKRITDAGTIVELDRGMYIPTGGLDTVLTYTKGNSTTETWSFFVMNENRDTASVLVEIYLGDGSAYGEIYHYPSITIGFPGNVDYPHYLDLDSGLVYDPGNVSGFEAEIDLAAFFYYTSGKPSPTLTCPAYPSAQTYYPEFAGWTVKNSTLYDYKTTDNDLISIEEFDAAVNDSLLVAGYLPQNVSGLCKFCYTGKVIPFKTAGGKYGMIKVIRADEQEGGSMELAIKIQQ